jgi:SAM-dependent methyltransferase
MSGLINTSPVQKDALSNLKKDLESLPTLNQSTHADVDDDDDSKSTSSEASGTLETDYGSAKYWNERYSRYSPFDWLMEYSTFKKQDLTSFIQTSDSILMLGCGSARFSGDMYDDGYHNIDNIDLSEVVIDQMKTLNEERHKMTWEVMDVTNLMYSNDIYDVVIDKSTLDCIFCCDNSAHLISEMILESWRVLKPGGIFIPLSLHTLDKVMPYINSDENGFDIDW